MKFNLPQTKEILECIRCKKDFIPFSQHVIVRDSIDSNLWHVIH